MTDSGNQESPRQPPLDSAFASELWHATNDVIFVNDPETGEILDVNEAVEDMYGYSREEARQLTIDDFSMGTPPYTQSQAVEYIRKAADGEPQIFEWQSKDSEGDMFWVEVSMRRAMREEETLILIIIRDISARKEQELTLEEQRDNLELLNEVLRHDVRNDLQIMRGYAEQLEQYVDEDAKELLDIVRKNASNAVDLTTTARDLSLVMLQSDRELQPFDVRSVLSEQVEEARSSYPNAEITIDDSVPQTDVAADEFLGSVFRNLLKNAVQHNDKDQPEVTVTAEQGGDTLDVRIVDNGPGIPDLHKDDILRKGEKRLESEGTGIGLDLVQTLIDGYDGDVWIEDNDPDGVVFVVQFHIAS